MRVVVKYMGNDKMFQQKSEKEAFLINMDGGGRGVGEMAYLMNASGRIFSIYPSEIIISRWVDDSFVLPSINRSVKRVKR